MCVYTYVYIYMFIHTYMTYACTNTWQCATHLLVCLSGRLYIMTDWVCGAGCPCFGFALPSSAWLDLPWFDLAWLGWLGLTDTWLCFVHLCLNWIRPACLASHLLGSAWPGSASPRSALPGAQLCSTDLILAQLGTAQFHLAWPSCMEEVVSLNKKSFSGKKLQAKQNRARGP